MLLRRSLLEMASVGVVLIVSCLPAGVEEKRPIRTDIYLTAQARRHGPELWTGGVAHAKLGPSSRKSRESQGARIADYRQKG